MGYPFLKGAAQADGDFLRRIVAPCERKLISAARRATAALPLFLMALAVPLTATAATEDGEVMVAGLQGDLTELSLDQLLNIEVTSVSKRPEKLLEAAAAAFVLTGEEIHRSGARNIAEALRLVPGLQVARTNSRTYNISARGFSSSGDKLQVLLDGRSVYTPLTSAVFWDVLDTFLYDIDRIEVIRGPGASLWGANAVNGVINIVTRNSSDTTGTVVRGSIGTEDRATAAIRSGTRIGDNGSLRFYARARDQGASVRADGSDARDSVKTTQAGVRSDWTLDSGQMLTVSGDIYSDRFNTPPPSAISNTTEPTSASGSNLLARWSSASWALQAYYDQYRRTIPATYAEQRDTVDLDFQQQFSLTSSNTLIYGLGYRRTHDETGKPPANAIIFQPSSRALVTENAFIQDQWSFAEGTYTVTAGSKFEHDDFNKLAVQPSLRFGWKAAPQAFTWAAVSRAVRRPNRINSDIALFCPVAIPSVPCNAGDTILIGNPSIKSENLTAYEWGLRIWSKRGVSMDLATFYNDYTDLISTETPIGYQNNIRAHSYGSELALNWQPRPNLDLQAFYSYLKLTASRKEGSTDTTTVNKLEGSDPNHQVGLRLSMQPADRWQLNGFLRYVDGLSAFSLPAYTELNLRVAYQLRPELELSLSGQNLLSSQHPEFGAASSRSEIERSATLGFTWHWQ